jgi:azurin
VKTQKLLPTFARSLALIGIVALSASPALAAARVIKLTGTDAMKYNLAQITAKPGEELTVQVTGIGTQDKAVMAHNFVLLAQGTDVNAFVVAASVARPTHIPKQEKWKKAILASTNLAGGGETVSVTFKAPAKAGAYTYVCTFPGHYNGGMKGVLTVK